MANFRTKREPHGSGHVLNSLATQQLQPSFAVYNLKWYSWILLFRKKCLVCTFSIQNTSVSNVNIWLYVHSSLSLTRGFIIKVFETLSCQGVSVWIYKVPDKFSKCLQIFHEIWIISWIFFLTAVAMHSVNYVNSCSNEIKHHLQNIRRCNSTVVVITSHKNIEIHTAHTIVSWPNREQWVIFHTSDLMMMIRQSTPPTKTVWAVLPAADSTLTLRLFQQVAVRKPLYVN